MQNKQNFKVSLCFLVLLLTSVLFSCTKKRTPVNVDCTFTSTGATYYKVSIKDSIMIAAVATKSYDRARRCPYDLVHERKTKRLTSKEFCQLQKYMSDLNSNDHYKPLTEVIRDIGEIRMTINGKNYIFQYKMSENKSLEDMIDFIQEQSPVIIHTDCFFYYPYKFENIESE